MMLSLSSSCPDPSEDWPEADRTEAASESLIQGRDEELEHVATEEAVVGRASSEAFPEYDREACM